MVSLMNRRFPEKSEFLDVQLAPADITTPVTSELGPYERWTLYLAVFSQGVLTFTGNAVDTQTIVIGGKTYTSNTVLGSDDGDFLIGVDAAASMDNLIAAITLGVGSSTLYAAATTLHPTVTAVRDTTLIMRAIAKLQGDQGSITTTETQTNASWDGVDFDAVIDTNAITIRLSPGGEVDSARVFYELPGAESPVTIDEGDEEILEFGYDAKEIQLTGGSNEFVRAQLRGIS